MATCKHYYHEWPRMLAAVAAADRNTVHTVQTLYLQRDDMAKGFLHNGQEQKVPETALAVARALGIDRRDRREWVPARHARPDSKWLETVEGDCGCMLQPDGTWACNAYRSGPVIYGHPTAESAIQHFERLRGRDLPRETVMPRIQTELSVFPTTLYMAVVEDACFVLCCSVRATCVSEAEAFAADSFERHFGRKSTRLRVMDPTSYEPETVAIYTGRKG